MPAPTQIPHYEELHDAMLAVDERWLLVQRIVASEGLQRAGQLRKILVHVSRSAILHPERALNEYEIACDVLDRRKDFDPTNDNIVRAQFTHLRRKLERYFAEAGATEALSLTIPRGSYIPVFTHSRALSQSLSASAMPASAKPVSAMLDTAATLEAEQVTGIPPTSAKLPGKIGPWWSRPGFPAAIAFLAICTVLLTVVLRARDGAVKMEGRGSDNGFATFLAKYEGNVAVVLPDTSTMMINYITNIDISAADYTSSDFPRKQIETMKDPEVRRVLTQLSKKRNTTASEAKMGYEFVEALTHAGGHGNVRYARDLHVRDLNDGSTILIGSPRSNPWVSLFIGKTNFQYVRNTADGQYGYRNMAALPGEQAIYPVSTADEINRVNYVDIAWMPNSTKSGFVLLIVGSDLESNEAAGKLLFKGRLPPELTSLLGRKDLHSFEIFLRGNHIEGESEDSLELLSIRSN